MEQLKAFFQSLPAFVRNRYFVTGLAFVVFMLFFDRNNLLTQYRRTGEFGELQDKKEFYEAEIRQIEEDRNELFGSPDKLEKFAREKYRMKKEDEDIFIIVEKE